MLLTTATAGINFVNMTEGLLATGLEIVATLEMALSNIGNAMSLNTTGNQRFVTDNAGCRSCACHTIERSIFAVFESSHACRTRWVIRGWARGTFHEISRTNTSKHSCTAFKYTPDISSSRGSEWCRVQRQSSHQFFQHKDSPSRLNSTDIVWKHPHLGT